MMRRLKSVVHDLLPPLLVRALRRRHEQPAVYRGDHTCWEDAAAAATGYDDAAILARVLRSALTVKAGNAAYERDSVLFDRIEYSWPLLAGLMWTAARAGGQLNVLDFGGALGTTYFQNRAFFRDLSVKWSVVEQPHFAAAGREHLEDGILRFFEDIDACVAVAAPHAVVMGAALQYVADPYGLLDKLAEVDHRLLVLDRTPWSALDADRITVQHVPPSIYPASYPCRIFSRANLLEQLAKRGWTPVETFTSADGRWVTDAGVSFEYGGLLATR